MKKKFILKPYKDYDIRLKSGIVVRICSFNPNNLNTAQPMSLSLLIEERKVIAVPAEVK